MVRRAGEAAVAFQRLVDVPHEAAVVEVAVGLLEVAPEELLLEGLLQHVEPERLVVQPDRGPGDAGRGDAGGAEQRAAHVFAQVGGVLDGVVQVQPAQTKHPPALDVLVERQRHRGPVVQTPETARRAF